MGIEEFVLDRAEKRGFKKGYQEGIEEARKEIIALVIKNIILEMNLTNKEIADGFDVPKSFIEDIRFGLKNNY